jgi:transcriptional regulator with XRE-family HTH domain
MKTEVRRKSTLRKSFAANLKRERKARGLSQEALAHSAGLARATIKSIERGERNIRIDTIERLVRALGIEPSELMRRAND